MANNINTVLKNNLKKGDCQECYCQKNGRLVKAFLEATFRVIGRGTAAKRLSQAGASVLKQNSYDQEDRNDHLDDKKDCF
jgi:hypothetical protein